MVQKKPPLDCQGWCLSFAFDYPMQPDTPQVPCVPVSTSETQASKDEISGSTTYGLALSEQAAIRYLIKECGWRTASAGVLQRGWSVKEVK